MTGTGAVAERAGLRFVGATPRASEAIRISALFVLGYLFINFLTSFHRYGDTPITLWSPANALSLLLLIESSVYAPAVFLASFLADGVRLYSKESVLTFTASELLITLNYVGVAILLRDGFGYDFRKATYSNVIRLIAIVPAAGALTGVIYCGSFYLTGLLGARESIGAFKTLWIGNSVGMIVLMPAATAAYDLLGKGNLISEKPMRLAATIVFVVFGLTALIIFSTALPHAQFLFTLLFLPTMWVAINYGFQAVAFTTLATQVILVTCMMRFHTSDFDFGAFQMQMFILAATGQLLGAAISERAEATRVLSRQQSDLARITSQATTGALAVAFAHEISQPLSSLSGYLHGAKRMLTGGQDAEVVASVLEKAEAEARRTREVITRIREFVASGALDLQDEDLTAIARKIVAMNEGDAHAHGVNLFLEAPERSLSARADRIAIEQALNNLMVNAIEMAEVGPQPTRNVWVRVERRGEEAILRVDDDGPGVAPELSDRLFEPFETTKPHGMGLGLTLAAQVAEKHGGRLSWRTLEPHGASFVIGLPVNGPGERNG